MLLALFTYTLLSRANRNQQTLALALILSGGASNLLDRFLHEGYVIDFINVGAGSLRTGIFNVADIAITIGVLMLLLPTLNAKVIEHPANPRPS